MVEKFTLMKTHFLAMLMLVAAFALHPAETKAQNLDNISVALQNGNSAEVAKYFDTSVEITIINNGKDYSKTHGELVLKDFFAHNTPSSFSFMHKGNSPQGAEYGIGTLVTNNGNFRTYVYIKQKGNTFVIQQLRFEKD